MDPVTILGVGTAFLMISITNFCYILKILKKYIDRNDANKDSITLLSKLPFHELHLIQSLVIISLPLLFVGGFMLIYGFSI